jgi:hypothetical protein
MDGFEVMMLFGFATIAGLAWYSYHRIIASLDPMLVQPLDRQMLLYTPGLCAIGLFLVLKTFGDPYVRNDLGYLIFYWLWGMCWLAMCSWLFPIMGFSLHDDGLQRRNTGATIALCGAFFGILAAYTGGNIGEGPGWWIVALCVIVSTGAFFLCWLALEYFTQISETITIERNASAGVRLAIFLIVIGIILGRSVSGNWIDMADFIVSFVVRAWYVLPLLAVAVFIEWRSRPTLELPRPTGMAYTTLPSLAYITFVVIAVILSTPVPPPVPR